MQEGGNKDTEEQYRIYYHSLQSSIKFWRSIGFRRIGDTCYFGYSNDRNHPSCRIDQNQDSDPPISARNAHD